MFNTDIVFTQDLHGGSIDGKRFLWRPSSMYGLELKQELMDEDLRLVEEEVREHNESDDFIW